MIEGAPWRRWVFFYVPVTGFVVALLFPFYWMIITTIRPDRELYRPWNAPNYNPFWTWHPTLEHITDLLTTTLFSTWMLNTMLISLGGVPGFLCAAWLVERWGRKPVCVGSLMGGGVMAFVYGQTALHADSVALLIGTGLVMQFFLFGMWGALYTYTPELYGTGARATGSGFASAIGRVGSLIGPYAVGLVLPVFGQSGVFTLGALSFAIAALAVWVMGIETRGLALESLAASDEPGGASAFPVTIDEVR